MTNHEIKQTIAEIVNSLDQLNFSTLQQNLQKLPCGTQAAVFSILIINQPTQAATVLRLAAEITQKSEEKN